MLPIMKGRILALVVFLLVLPSVGSGKPTKTGKRVNLAALAQLSQHVGEYPCSNGITSSRVFRSALKSTLKLDYQSYLEFLQFAGCGQIEKHDDYLLMDLSQEHVGGYGSLVFVHIPDNKVHLFWLKERVWDKKWQIYGERPIPPPILRLIEANMNEGWGHVATFTFEGEQLQIDLRQK